MCILGLISDFNLLGCGHCKKMKPEYDEAAEILNKGVDVSFTTVLFFFFHTVMQDMAASHYLLIIIIIILLVILNAVGWSGWLVVSIRLLSRCFLIAGCVYTLSSFATLSSVVNKHPPSAEGPIKLQPGVCRNDFIHKLLLGLLLGPSPCGCLPRTGGQWEKLSYYLKWID